ncbi:MAG: acyltransferase family protein [Dermatophilaceae bacterium]
MERDRWADTLRVGSLLVVILGHWLMVTVTPDGDISNALVVLPSLQPLTWFLQVMPLFFLVGGVAHAYSLQSRARLGGTARGQYAGFVRARSARLLRPTLVFLLVWVLIGAVADLAGWTSGPQATLVVAALVMVPQLLWFVGIYLGVAAFAPAMARAHTRWGLAVPITLALAACLVDLARFGAAAGVVGNLNFALVWLCLHQWGFIWYAGALSNRLAVGLVVVGSVGLGLAVTVGPYPTSMVGLPGDDVSNMAPPTVALLAQGVALIGVAALVRGPMGRLLHRPGAWRAVVTAGAFAMTAFLWHLTALLAVLLGMRALGRTQPDVGTAAWWASRPVWFLVLSVPTAALVAVFVRFDRPQRARRTTVDESRAWVDPSAAVAVAVVVFGILMVSVTGVDILGNRPQFFLFGQVTPAVSFAVLLVGLALLRLAAPRRAAPRPAGLAQAAEPAP